MAAIFDMPPPSPDRKSNSNNHGSPYGGNNYASGSASAHGTNGLHSYEPPDTAAMMPKIDFVLIANKAEKGKAGDANSLADAQSDVEHHHRVKGQAVVHELTNQVMGERKEKETRKDSILKQIDEHERLLTNISQWVTTDVIKTIKRTPFQWFELAFATVALIVMMLWSVTSLSAFLINTAVIDNPAYAYIIACLPMLAAIALDQVWHIFTAETPKKIVTGVFLIIAISATIIWVATFGSEAGQGHAAQSLLNAADAETLDTSMRLMTRVVAQVLIELSVGALLWHSFWALLTAGQREKEHRVAPQWQHMRASLDALENELNGINNILAKIEEWEKIAEQALSAYVSKAKAHFDACISIN